MLRNSAAAGIGRLSYRAGESGAIYLDAPAKAVDGNGFLRDEFCNADPTHGNARYGRLVLDQILSGIGATT